MTKVHPYINIQQTFTNVYNVYWTNYNTVHVSLELSQAVWRAVLTKYRFKSSCIGSGAPAWFPSSQSHTVYCPIHSCSVCLPQQELSLSPNTTRLTGRFTVKCKNQKRTVYISLRCLTCQQPLHGWSACSLIHSVHVHAQAVCG